VVPDIERATQVLLVPLTRLAGIESPALLKAGGPNYWQAAWTARRYVSERSGQAIPRDKFAMAINSPYSRSQNQLHIHVDCVSPGVRRSLAGLQDHIGPAWTLLPVRLEGLQFRARRLSGEDLGSRDPFKLLARGDAFARAHMEAETLVVVGARFLDGSPGFYLLSGRLNPAAGDPAFGEELLDHSCTVLNRE